MAVVGSVAASLGPNQPMVVLPAPSPVTMTEPSTTLVPRMSMLPATTTPISVLGALAGSVNDPISTLVCGATSVAVWSAWLSNSVAPVNSSEFVKCVYAVGLSVAIGPLIVQLLKRRLLPSLNPCELVAVSAVFSLNEPLFMRLDQFIPSPGLVVVEPPEV